MKLLIPVLCFLLVFGRAQVFSQGAPVSGQQLEIGPSGSNQVNDHAGSVPSGAIGSGNYVRLFGSLAVGTGNYLGGSWPTGGFPYGGWNSMALGNANSVYSDSSLAIGYGNWLAGSDYEWTGGSTSLVVGQANSSAGRSSLIVGVNNIIVAEYSMGDNWDMSSTSLFGHGLVSGWRRCLVAGQYNLYENLNPPAGTSPLLMVGNGSDSVNRANAFVIYSGGQIRMAPQGDVLMGEFGNP